MTKKDKKTDKVVKKKDVVNPPHRRSDYTEEKAKNICDWISSGKSLRKFCERKGAPNKTTVLRWLRQQEAFRTQYARARDEQAESIFDEMLDIADDATNDYEEVEREDGSTFVKENHEVIQRSRLRIETRKWMAGKLKPKKYGTDLMDLTSGGEKIVSTGFKQITKKQDVETD